MRSADNGRRKLLGATFIELYSKKPSEDTVTTKQMVYITPNTEAFYLSRKGCEDLGLISGRFPTIGDTTLNMEASVTSLQTSKDHQEDGLA